MRGNIDGKETNASLPLIWQTDANIARSHLADFHVKHYVGSLETCHTGHQCSRSNQPNERTTAATRQSKFIVTIFHARL